MKSTTTTIYESPKARVIEIDIQSLVCASPLGQNESYEEGDTSDWFNN